MGYDLYVHVCVVSVGGGSEGSVCVRIQGVCMCLFVGGGMMTQMQIEPSAQNKAMRFDVADYSKLGVYVSLSLLRL